VGKARVQPKAAVGVAEHGNSAVLVTVAPGGEFLDRRRIDLTRGLPTHPYHHEGSWAVGRYLNSSWARRISIADAVVLVERVRESAARGARESLEALAAAVPVPIANIGIRVCPKLPPTTEERIADNRAANVADSVMYREALATAAEARGWSVSWYDRERVFRDAAAGLGREDVDEFLLAMGRPIGPPWQAKHKLAAAAALAAGGAAANSSAITIDMAYPSMVSTGARTSGAGTSAGRSSELKHAVATCSRGRALETRSYLPGSALPGEADESPPLGVMTNRRVPR